MSEQQQDFDYNEYAPQAGGRLFTSAMFGFNKEEVLEYLEEMADENTQRQEADERRIQELSKRIQALETGSGKFSSESFQPDPHLAAQLEEQQRYLEAAQHDLEVTRAATYQSESELQEFRNQLCNTQQENSWLREEFQKYEQAYNQLAQQMQSAPQEEWSAPSPEMLEFQNQLQQQLQQSENEIQALHQQLQQSQQNQAAMQQAENEIRALHQQLQESQQSQVAMQQANVEIQTLQQKLQYFQQENQQYQQASHELQELKQQLESYQNEHKKFEKTNTEIKELQQKIKIYNQDREQLTLAHTEMQGLQNQLQQMQLEQQKMQQEYEQKIAELAAKPVEANSGAQQTASAILAEANAEANRILDGVTAEKERLHRQMRNSAGGLAESITTLRSEISTVEGDVSNVLESVQLTLNDVMSALARTEQNLSTFGVQVERFPTSAPAVSNSSQKRQSYFQSEQASTSDPMPPVRQPAAAKPTEPRRETSAPAARANNVRPFRPTYSSSPTASSGWPQTSEAFHADEEEETSDVRLRDLSDSLVDTLRQMMN